MSGDVTSLARPEHPADLSAEPSRPALFQRAERLVQFRYSRSPCPKPLSPFSPTSPCRGAAARPRRLSRGNTGVPLRPPLRLRAAGPARVVNALTHGNELCGMVAATHLLDQGVRPADRHADGELRQRRGLRSVRSRRSRSTAGSWCTTSTASGRPNGSMAARTAPSCAARASCARRWPRPTTSSTSIPPASRCSRSGSIRVRAQCGRSAGDRPAGRAPGDAQRPGRGTPVIQHGRHGQADGTGVALVAECGQHFLQASADLAIAVTLDFLAHFGLVERAGETARRRSAASSCWRPSSCGRRSSAFARPLVGFESSRKDELIATDGSAEIRAPCDDCTIFMPARTAIVGREGGLPHPTALSRQRGRITLAKPASAHKAAGSRCARAGPPAASAQMLPPCASTIARQIDRPRPAPRWSPRPACQKGWNMDCSSLAGSGGPLLATQ